MKLSELTNDEIEDFWRACGWREIKPCTCTSRLRAIPPQCTDGEDRHLPDVSDLNAVFEALEWLCGKRSRLLWEIGSTNYTPPSMKYYCALDDASVGEDGLSTRISTHGASKAEAIIRAVLAAHRSEQQTQTVE